MFRAVNAASIEALEQAMVNAEVRGLFAQVFGVHIVALAPTEAVTVMMRDLEARHIDVEGFMRRFPRYATIIAEAWSKAIKQTSDILARGIGLGVSPRLRRQPEAAIAWGSLTREGGSLRAEIEKFSAWRERPPPIR